MEERDWRLQHQRQYQCRNDDYNGYIGCLLASSRGSKLPLPGQRYKEKWKNSVVHLRKTNHPPKLRNTAAKTIKNKYKKYKKNRSVFLKT